MSISYLSKSCRSLQSRIFCKLFCTYGIFALLLLFGPTFFSIEGDCQEIKFQGVAAKTLSRVPDPVIMHGKLANQMIGKPIQNLRLYAFRNGTFEPIRYQIDEMSEDGDMIFPEGLITNGELGNGMFDAQDLLLFMAHDTGDKVANTEWEEGYETGTEIEIVDPLTGEKGWCYLLYFVSNPPIRSSFSNYVRFDYNSNTIESDYYKMNHIIASNGKRTFNYTSICMTAKAGANGKNPIDRFKVRPYVKLLFGSVKIQFHEEMFKSYLLGYKSGPVRVVRRFEEVATLPGGLKVLRIVLDITNYRSIYTSPLLFEAPFQLDKVFSTARLIIGTEYNPDALGGKFYNSRNQQGFLVNGKMDDELHFDTEYPEWALVTGDFGTNMIRTYLTKNILENITCKAGILDDITKKEPPESYPGTIGWHYWDFDLGKAKRGKYEMFMQNSFIPYYKRGDEIKYQNVMDHLLKIHVENQNEENGIFVISALGKKYD